jgi:hypothetical protein
MDARARGGPPIGYGRFALPHGAKCQKCKAQDLGDHCTVGVGERFADEIGTRLRSSAIHEIIFWCWLSASTTNSESSPCSMTLRLYPARGFGGALLISAGHCSRDKSAEKAQPRNYRNQVRFSRLRLSAAEGNLAWSYLRARLWTCGQPKSAENHQSDYLVLGSSPSPR